MINEFDYQAFPLYVDGFVVTDDIDFPNWFEEG